jgi:CheY-like chemotaxis protein
VSHAADRSKKLSTRGHILVAEDNLVNQKIVSKLLEVLGYSCALTLNGEQAVAMASEEPFDLVLMDCEMPVMDGYEATRVIRSLAGYAGQIAIVALTANAMEGVREKCKQAGMDDYLSKPLQKMDLEEVLGRYILTHDG